MLFFKDDSEAADTRILGPASIRNGGDVLLRPWKKDPKV